MAEQSIDDLLRDSFARQAQPGDSAGVADVIRSRVAASDPGISAASSTAPGWGGAGLGTGGALGILIGLIVAGGALGGILGANGVFGAPVHDVSLLPPSSVVVATADVYACPGGAFVGQLRGGDHVVAVARSDDSGMVGVRDPGEVGRTLWLDAAALLPDAGQPALAALPVAGCPIAVDYVVPAPVVPDQPQPQQPNAGGGGGGGSAPAADTTAPSVGGGSVNVVCPAAVVSVNASDNVGVTRVDISYSGNAHPGSGSMSPSGGTWTFSYDSYALGTGNVTFVMTAFDAAGNKSTTSTSKNIQCVF
ncbi:MAG: hypothetical protein J0G30_04375 [Actinomycetales bacterium]|nr:hypothetical protein [Actinomycetales bacterium]